MDMLRITNLKKHFGDKEVLTGLNLSVPEHSVFGFVGENGAVCFLEESRISSISFLPIGSSAEVGSSQIKILGRPRSACAIPSRCFIPLENPLIR